MHMILHMLALQGSVSEDEIGHGIGLGVMCFGIGLAIGRFFFITCKA